MSIPIYCEFRNNIDFYYFVLYSCHIRDIVNNKMFLCNTHIRDAKDYE